MKNGKRILSVTIRQMYDDSPDMSHLGEYSTKAESTYSIDRHHAEDCQSIKPTNDEATGILERAAEYLDGQYPEDGELQEAMRESLAVNESIRALEDARESVTECDCNQSFDSRSCEYFNPSWKNYKGCPEDEIRKYCRQDYERAEALNRGEWSYLGIKAEAEIELSPDSCTQEIESGELWGIESDGGKEYLQEIEDEQLAELRTELRAIGFSARAISTAFKTIEHKEL